MSKVVVFDFDKTLTYKDSLRELFLQEMIGLKYSLRLFYLILAFFSKLKIITVKKEKELMIALLFHSDRKTVERKCHELARSLALTPLFNLVKEYVNDGDRVIIMSASAEYLLKEIFKDLKVEIIGTSFECDNNRIKRIIQHPYSKEKYEVLTLRGIEKVDEMYYDSLNDECLIPICKEWNKVKNGIIVETHNG